MATGTQQTVTVTHQGRKLTVKVPRPEQFMMVESIAEELKQADTSQWTGAEAMSALNRMYRMMLSLLTTDDDRKWMDDAMLTGEFGLESAMELAIKVVNKATGSTKKSTARRAET